MSFHYRLNVKRTEAICSYFQDFALIVVLCVNSQRVFFHPSSGGLVYMQTASMGLGNESYYPKKK